VVKGVIMPKLKVNEYAKLMQCDATTVYRWIKSGKVKTETIDGVLHVNADETELQRHATANAESNLIIQMQAELERQTTELDKKNDFINHLQQELASTRQELDSVRQRYDATMRQMQTDIMNMRQSHDAIVLQIQQDSAEAQQRSDTIILQLTRQFEQQTVLLEDMRNRPSFWQRLKMGFVRFATPSATEQNVTEQRN
jgi:septal ring factor EnvC (AmiA/AmiB activator)